MTPTPITVPLQSPVTPVTFRLQGTGELDIRSIVATWDGSGAGSAFYPVISVYTSDDRLLSRTRVQDAVTAGDSVVATFAPFLRKQAAATPSGGVLGGFLVTPAADTTLAAGATTKLTFATLVLDQGSVVSTSDNQNFDLIDGLWVVGCQTYWHPNAVSPNADGAVQHNLNLSNMTNPAHLCTVLMQMGRDGGGSINVDMQAVSTFAARTSGHPGTSLLSVTVTNLSHGSQIVRSREDRTFLWGVCLST